jgi:NADP-dependent 3-hydroxy acid dehydrogenase YdfG
MEGDKELPVTLLIATTVLWVFEYPRVVQIATMRVLSTANKQIN